MNTFFKCNDSFGGENLKHNNVFIDKENIFTDLDLGFLK